MTKLFQDARRECCIGLRLAGMKPLAIARLLGIPDFEARRHIRGTTIDDQRDQLTRQIGVVARIGTTSIKAARTGDHIDFHDGVLIANLCLKALAVMNPTVTQQPFSTV